jgi:ribosomal protein L37AE/L43A
MCPFCENIESVDEYRKAPFWKRDNCIVKLSNKTYGLWVECDDSYYSRVIMSIGYCPKCGREL